MRHRIQLRFPLVWVVLLSTGFWPGASNGQQIVVEPAKPDAVYGLGEPIQWNVSVQGPNAGRVDRAHFVLKRDGYTPLQEGELDLTSGHGMLQTRLSQPGTVLAIVTTSIPGADGKAQRVLGGAAVAPRQIQPTSPKPADFDSFWAEQIQKLDAIPEHAELTPVENVAPGVRYFKLRMDNINQTHIYAQLAEPAAKPNAQASKYPALLILQWAGVYGLPTSRVVQPAQKGWLTLNVMPHDLPLDEDDAFYKKEAETTLKNYAMIGSDHPQTSYFLRMYLSAYRAAQYLMHRDDWDGHTLVITGASQGGQQTICMAGLLGSKVTAMMALVPSSCDVTGPEKGRAIGFPNWYEQAQQRHDPAILQTGRYFDPVNFASGVTCPALVAMGLLDETSPPTGVFAAVNQMKGKAVPLILVHSPHQDVHGSQQPFDDASGRWLDALAHGQPVPPGP